MKAKKKILISTLIGIAVLAAILLITKSCRNEARSITYETAKVTRKTITNTVTATGTLQAIKTVAVGTQVSGVISKLYADYNSHVKKGQLLAELDKRSLTMNLQNAQASYENAKAEVTYQTSNFNRVKALWDKQLVAESDYDLALYNFTKAKATMKNATSEYEKAKVNLEYAYIYSPIDGVVLQRAVDEGQTVAASFSTPTLFSIANDLTQMQVEASIDEADIGQIKNGQKVSFTVDAFPEMNFTGEITEIRMQPVTTNNVVTYTVIIKAPNPDLKLMPGMTASIIVTVEEAKDALSIPSKALRFKPDSTLMMSIAPKLPVNGKESSATMPAAAKPEIGSNNEQEYSEIWVKEGNSIHPVRVQIGINDDINAQVVSGLRVGEEVVISMSLSGNSDSSSSGSGATGTTTSKSPFMPTPPKRK